VGSLTDDVDGDAGLGERTYGTDVRRAARSAAAEHQPNGAAGQEASKPREVGHAVRLAGAQQTPVDVGDDGRRLATEDALGTADVMVRRAPVASAQPVDRVARLGAVLAVQQDQLLLRAHSDTLQLLLERSGRPVAVSQRHDQDAVGLIAHTHTHTRARATIGYNELGTHQST